MKPLVRWLTQAEAMDEQLLGSIERDLSSTSVSPNVIKIKTLASARSLIVNPSTSVSTLTSLLQALLLLLRNRSRTLHPQLLLTLLSDLSLRHSHLYPLVRHHSHSLSLLLGSHSTCLAAQSLALLAADPTSQSEFEKEEEEAASAFVSLCFRPSVSVRPWLLSNAGKFRVHPSLLLTLLLGFTKDPYPRVRRAALDGLVTLCRAAEFDKLALVQGCYFRAGELLSDMEDCIRVSAIHAVREWGLKLVALHEETSKIYWSDALFLKLCCMVRDMSVKVRVEAFNALGQMKIVTENILLQALHKRVDEKYLAGQCSAEEFKKQAPNIAGAFVHGLEDEFSEVRNSACHALWVLIILSSKFAGEALNSLMDVLYDDSLIVRLQALKTMSHMASYNYMTVQETHKHMFLGTLCDSSSFVRFEARKILPLIKVNFNVFNSCVNKLLENLETYPQDEADIFNVLFKFGHAHENFVLRFIKQTFPEIDSLSEGKIDIDNTKVAAALVLAISVPLSYKKPDDGDPDRQRIFSCSIAFLGRFSCALNDFMSQSTLLDYLLHYSKSTTFPGAEFELKSEDPLLTLHEEGVPEYASGQPTSPAVEHASVLCYEVTNYLDVILSQTKDQWQFVQCGRISEAMRILRIFKKELGTFSTNCLWHTGAITFVAEYLRVVKLLAKAWEHFLNPTKLIFSFRDLDLVLRKLNRRLREMRYRFIGLSKEEELHVLELILVSCIHRLSQAGNGIDHHSALKKLSATIYHAKSLCIGQSIEPSEFVVENVKLCNEYDNFSDGDCYRPSLFKHLLDFFSLKGFVLSKSLKHIKADLDVQGYDSIHPLAFISGLPVGIPFEITLYNIMGDKRLWLSMAADGEFTQYAFLDLNQFENCDGVRKLTFTAPFYSTPKVVSFRLKFFIGMECDSDELHFVKGFGGPKRELVHLCQEREMYLSVRNV